MVFGARLCACLPDLLFEFYTWVTFIFLSFSLRFFFWGGWGSYGGNWDLELDMEWDGIGMETRSLVLEFFTCDSAIISKILLFILFT